MPERQPHVVEPLEETLPAELVYLEGGREALSVAHLTTFEVYGQAVALKLSRAPHEFGDLLVLERDGEHAVLRAVVLEDVGEGGGDDCAEAVVEQGPGRVLARRAAAEVTPGEEHRGARVARLV